MENDNQKVVVLFANISESTKLYERMDNDTATHMIKECLSLMQKITETQMGDVLNITGDKANCIFWDATSAVLAAKGMHEAIEGYLNDGTQADVNINLHIGIHTGPVQKEGNEIFGDTVNILAKVTQIAKPREIMITEPVFDELEDMLKSSARHTKILKFKDNSPPLKLYEYIWEDYETTIAVNRTTFSMMETVENVCLELTYQNQKYKITNQAPQLKLGRQRQNDIVIRSESISRFHAFIELRNNRFILSDQSTNGTFVYPKDGHPYSVKQAEAFLEGSGSLCLGEDNCLDSPARIHYRIKDIS